MPDFSKPVHTLMNIKFPPPHKDLGAFFALRAKNRAFRSNLFYRSAVKKDFRYKPWRAHQRQTEDLRITLKSAGFFAPQKKPPGVVYRLRRVSSKAPALRSQAAEHYSFILSVQTEYHSKRRPVSFPHLNTN
jgi:hypothetical protein